MTAAAWIALAMGAITIFLNLLVLAIGYGVLKGTVNALAARVAALETEMSTLGDLKVDVGKVETRIDGLVDQFKELNATLRWLREPAAYTEINRPKGS